MPRKLKLKELVGVLVAEHSQMRAGLDEVRGAVGRSDFGAASKALKEVDKTFRQHIADEESQVLGFLIREFGVEGAAEEIKVFQQHRPIHRLMEAVAGLASLPPAELESDAERLRALFEDHTLAEEDRVFPKALAAAFPS